MNSTTPVYTMKLFRVVTDTGEEAFFAAESIFHVSQHLNLGCSGSPEGSVTTIETTQNVKVLMPPY